MKHLSNGAKNRLLQLLKILMGLSIFSGLLLYAMGNAADLYFLPTDLISESPSHRVKLGGVVVPDQIYFGDNLNVTFDVTDSTQSVRVQYQGVLPDLFKAGQSIVVSGHYYPADHVFYATEVLAKHDEKYEPSSMRQKI